MERKKTTRGLIAVGVTAALVTTACSSLPQNWRVWDNTEQKPAPARG